MRACRVADYLDDLNAGIQRYRDDGLLDPDLYQAYLSGFTFCPPESLPRARSIIIVAVPQPRVRLTFRWRGATVPATIPPTYPERHTERRVRELVSDVLEPSGYHVLDAALPKKLLAVQSGLARYGRNNISYVPGMGSFHGLVALFSGLPAGAHSWYEPRMLECCRICSACWRLCPVDAIDAERFLLHAGRCITYHNEKPGDVPFPASIDPAWHNCLVGCLHCQRACPENKEVWHWVADGPSFSEEETRLLVEGAPLEELAEPTIEKLRNCELDHYTQQLPRNLGALLAMLD
jgi:epoxyqueuosine reductase